MKKFLFLAFLVFPGPLYAADGSASSLWGLFRLGGIWMWFLLLLSVLSAGFILEKLYAFHKAKLNASGFFQRLESLVERKDAKELQSFLESSDVLVSKVIGKNIHLGINLAEFEKSIERTSSVSVNELGRGLNILATIGSVAPLIGFLGTVAGMITAFGNIAAADEVSAQLVAGGIYTALTTTAYGLIISIPTIGMYNYFVHRIDNFLADTEKAVNLIIEEKIIT